LANSTHHHHQPEEIKVNLGNYGQEEWKSNFSFDYGKNQLNIGKRGKGAN